MSTALYLDTRIKPKIEMSKTQKENWIVRLNNIIESSSKNLNLENKELAERLEISERDFFRKVKKATGLTPQKYLRKYRMHQAYANMKDGIYKTVKETAHSVGYINVSYFIIQFEKEFDKKPLQILKEFGWR